MKLVELTAVKAIANSALRWVPPFLPTLEAAFGSSTRQMTTILGLSEMAGLSTVGVGRFLDRGRELLITKLSLIILAVSSLVTLVGTTFAFAVGFVLVVLGVANLTVAGHAYLSSRTPYAERGRAIGLYETSWAFALLIGAPTIAWLISAFGWRGPYVMLALASLGAAAYIHVAAQREVAPPPPVDDDPGAAATVGQAPRLTRSAWLVISGSAGLAMAGLSVFAISGSWLDDAFGVETAGLGAIAMAFGGIELVASTATARFVDRIGKLRSTLLGIGALVAGVCVMGVAGSALWIGIGGLLLFLGGFEFAFVTSLSLVTEAMPEARGTTIALSNGVGTVARGTGTIAGGWLFTAHGINGSIALSLAATACATAAFVLSRR